MTCDRSSLQTFKKSNIYPQYKIHNNHVWNSWEEYTRKKAKAKNNLLVITGITKGDKLFAEMLLQSSFIYCVFLPGLKVPVSAYQKSGTKFLCGVKIRNYKQNI